MKHVRILIVDDSLIMRKMLTVLLSKEPDFEVVAAAARGEEALKMVEELKPDVVTLDLIMPGIGGMEVLRRVRKSDPLTRVIMFSVLTAQGAQATVEAMALGAADFVPKPSRLSEAADAMSTISSQLVPKIRALAHGAAGRSAAQVKDAVPAPPRAKTAALPLVVAIGVSTGGPEVLSAIIPELPAAFRLPVLVVQHIPSMFVRHLVARLSERSKLPIRVASSGDLVEPGTVLFCPGGCHMAVEKDGADVRIRLNEDPPVNACRPSADVLFKAVARAYGAEAVAVVLTGMGSDGLDGCRDLHAGGARILVQDAASSVVWGMPGAVFRAGLAHRTLDPEGIAAELVRLAALGH